MTNWTASFKNCDDQTFARSEYFRNRIKLASHPIRLVIAIKIACLLAAEVSLTVGKILLSKHQEPSAMHTAKLASRLQEGFVDDKCRTIEVEIDDGYSVRGHVTRTVCRKIF
jgi:hypothetical protein